MGGWFRGKWYPVRKGSLPSLLSAFNETGGNAEKTSPSLPSSPPRFFICFFYFPFIVVDPFFNRKIHFICSPEFAPTAGLSLALWIIDFRWEFFPVAIDLVPPAAGTNNFGPGRLLVSLITAAIRVAANELETSFLWIKRQGSSSYDSSRKRCPPAPRRNFPLLHARQLKGCRGRATPRYY